MSNVIPEEARKDPKSDPLKYLTPSQKTVLNLLTEYHGKRIPNLAQLWRLADAVIRLEQAFLAIPSEEEMLRKSDSTESNI